MRPGAGSQIKRILPVVPAIRLLSFSLFLSPVSGFSLRGDTIEIVTKRSFPKREKRPTKAYKPARSREDSTEGFSPIGAAVILMDVQIVFH